MGSATARRRRCSGCSCRTIAAAASVGNGVHVGFIGRSKAVIETFHRAALEAGGTDEGAPGARPDYGPHYFGAFVRDLDGNKLEAVLVAGAAPAKSEARAKKLGQARKKKVQKKSKKAAKKAPKTKGKRSETQTQGALPRPRAERRSERRR